MAQQVLKKLIFEGDSRDEMAELAKNPPCFNGWIHVSDTHVRYDNYTDKYYVELIYTTDDKPNWRSFFRRLLIFYSRRIMSDGRFKHDDYPNDRGAEPQPSGSDFQVPEPDRT